MRITSWVWVALGVIALSLIIRGAFRIDSGGMLGWMLVRCVTVVFTATIGAAVGARVSARRGKCRTLRMLPHEAMVRAARQAWMPAMGAMSVMVDGWLGALLSALGGSFHGYLSGVRAEFLSSPEQIFLTALEHARAGRQEEARVALRVDLESPGDDPDCPHRIPLARRFLEDHTASLEMVTELEAAAAPAGRGIEPEAAAAPAGKGTEPESAATPHQAERAGRSPGA